MVVTGGKPGREGYLLSHSQHTTVGTKGQVQSPLVWLLEGALLPPASKIRGEPFNILAGAPGHSTHNGLVNIYVTIPDFKIKATIRIGANPGLIVNGRPLAAKIG